MASQDSEQAIYSLLKCASCKVDLVSDNQPKSLSCLHTYCTPCLSKERESFVQGANISCPVCRAIISRSSEENTDITTDLKLDVMIEKLLNVRQLQQSERLCQMCSEGVASTRWCQDCKKFFCDSCLVHHEQYKPNDKLIDVSEGIESEDKIKDFILPTSCSRHEGEKFKLYCTDCEICLCSICLLEHCAEKEKKCVPVSIEKMAPDTKSQGRQLLEEINSQLEKDKQQIEGMKVKIESVNSQHKKTSDNIWKQAEEIWNVLKENTQCFMKELETKVKNETNIMQEMIQLKEDHIKKMEIINVNLSQLLQHFDDVDIFLNFSRLKQKSLSLMEAGNIEEQEDFCKSCVDLEHNIWYEKTQRMVSNFRSDKLRIENLRKNTPQLKQVEENVPLVPKLLESERKISLSELTKEMKELYSCDRFISSIFVCDENRVWVCDESVNELNVFSCEDKLITICKPEDMQRPRDVCLLSSDKIGVVDGNLMIFEKKKNAPFLTLLKKIPTDVNYVSICYCFGKILACDSKCGVYLLSSEGDVLRTVLDVSQNESPCHRISCGPFLDTFLLLDYKCDRLFCYSLFDSKLMFTHKTGPMTSDVCTDNRGNIYVVNGVEIYALNAATLQKNHLFPIGGGLIWPRIFIKMDKLYLTSNTLKHSYDTSGKCEVKIMSISY